MTSNLRVAKSNIKVNSDPTVEYVLQEMHDGNLRLIVGDGNENQYVMHFNKDGTFTRIPCSPGVAGRLGLSLDKTNSIKEYGPSSEEQPPDTEKFSMRDLEELETVALNAVYHVGAVNYAEREKEAQNWVSEAFEKAAKKLCRKE